MSLDYNKKNIPLAQKLRENATPQENHLWYDYLAKYEIRFQRQKAIDNFIADFYCHKAKLIIEIDGSQHYKVRITSLARGLPQSATLTAPSSEGASCNSQGEWWRGK